MLLLARSGHTFNEIKVRHLNRQLTVRYTAVWIPPRLTALCMLKAN
jgi:hypothetical protein